MFVAYFDFLEKVNRTLWKYLFHKYVFQCYVRYYRVTTLMTNLPLWHNPVFILQLGTRLPHNCKQVFCLFLIHCYSDKCRVTPSLKKYDCKSARIKMSHFLKHTFWCSVIGRLDFATYHSFLVRVFSKTRPFRNRVEPWMPVNFNTDRIERVLPFQNANSWITLRNNVYQLLYSWNTIALNLKCFPDSD